MPDLILVLTTMPDTAAAEALARTLVDERLGACVNVYGSMTSVYRWKGGVEREVERQLVIKTTRDRVHALQARLHELHPYELPEFLILGAEGSAAYAAWVSDGVSPR